MSDFGRQLQREIGEPVAQASQAAGEAGGEGLMSGMKAKVAAGALAVGAAAGALALKGLETSLAKGKASATLMGQLDISAKDAKKAGQVAGQLWTSSVTETVEEGAEAVKLVLGTGLVDSSASTKEIGKIATSVSDLAGLFDQDVTMAAKAAASMVNSGFAKSGTEAVDAMTWGFQNLGVKAEDLAETFNEYSPFLNNFGLTVKDSLGLMSQGLKAGAWDTDKIGDSFKELYLRITGGDQAVQDALKSIGLGGTGVMKAIADGGPGARKALDQILDALRETTDETTKARAVQDLFGGPGEDLGAAIFSLNVDTASKKIGDFSGAAKKAGDNLRSDVGTQFETFKRKALMAIGDAVGRYALPALMDFGQYLHTDVLPPVQAATGWLADKFGPAVRGTGDVISGVVGWFKEWGIWLSPLAVLVGGVTLALAAQGITTSITIGIMGAYSLASRGIATVTRGWAAAQALLNTVMSLNPFVLVAIALVALGVALVVAWKRSETFRDIVMGAWAGIQAGAMWMWTAGIKPAFDGIMAAIRWVGDAAVWLWTSVLQPTFSAIDTGARILATVLTIVLFLPVYAIVKLLGALFVWLWDAAIKPAFGWIAAGASGLWTALSFVFGLFMAGLKTVGGWFGWLWTAAVKPVLGWIAVGASGLWTALSFVFGLFMTGLKTVGGWFKWLWNAAVKPVLGWIATGAKGLWTGLSFVFGLFMAGLKTVGGWFKWLWEKAVAPALSGIKGTVSSTYDRGIKPIFDKLGEATGKVGDAFEAARKAIKVAWDKIKGIAKAPVDFIIGTVYNGGIVRVWNAVAGTFGAPKLDPIPGYARGGVLPGQSSYRQGDDQLVPMRRGEGVAVSEAMRDPYERARLLAVNKAALQGRSLRPFQGEGFAKGGILGWVKSAASKPLDLAKAGYEWMKDGVKASAEAGLNRVVKPLLKKIAGDPSVYRDMISGIPMRMIRDIVGYADEADKEMEKQGVGGGSYRKGLTWARTQAGKAYQWGGNGNPSWDCSGFVSAIESVIRGESPHRRWATGSFSGAQAPGGWVLNRRSPYMIGITNAGVGHTAGTLNGVNVESRGGDGVVVGARARSYKDSLFTHRYGFAAKGYADGGKPRPGEIAWVGEQGPELVRFRGGEEVYNNADSMRMWEGIGARGFAKGSKGAAASARKDLPGDLNAFTRSLTGSAADIARAAAELAKDLRAAGGSGKRLAATVTTVSGKLQAMAKQRDALAGRIATARQAATDQAKSAKDYLGLANIADPTSINGVLAGMKDRQATVKAFQGQIAGLSKRGLSQDLISQLVAMGPDSELAGLLSRASAGQIKQLNASAKIGGTLSTSYGRTMADAMYDSGRMAGKGFLTGLLADEAAIQAAMARLGAGAVKAIRSKKGLDAHSPSRKGVQAGADLGAGLVAGMVAAGPAVESAAVRLGQSAVPAGLVPVTAGQTAPGGGGLDGRPLYLVVEDGTVLRAWVDDRVDEGLSEVRRSKRSGAGRKG
ncbi:phage tail tape measure protein [Streptomyces sp. NPDC052077]|uniref:phage tail tape measure protein n=1 Tax=Streptomyces sp. NPDC052077 TaxID=3154757 RepID=UPI0034385E39